MSDHVAVFNEGRIEQVGTPQEVYERPRTEFVAGFVGTSNVVERGGRRVSIRPERIRLDGDLRATVAETVYVGSFVRYVVETQDGERLTVVRQSDGERLQPGTAVGIGWRDEDAFEITSTEEQEGDE